MERESLRPYAVHREKRPIDTRALDLSFEITQVAAPPYDGPRVVSTCDVTSYTKRYPYEAGTHAEGSHGGDGADGAGETEEASGGDGDKTSALYAAYDDETVVAFAACSTFWNGYASLDDIAVSRPHRGHGAARALLDAVCDWARKRGLKGVRAETQHNNLGACRMYEAYGFVLAGFDRMLYSATKHRDEVALFYYLEFGEEPQERRS